MALARKAGLADHPGYAKADDREGKHNGAADDGKQDSDQGEH